MYELNDRTKEARSETFAPHAHSHAHEDKLPDFYKGYIDDIFALVPDLAAATDFLSVLNDAHSAIQFTMKTEKRPTKGFYSIIRAILTIDNI